MANKFYQDADGLWWLNNKVIVPSKEIGFRVDDPAAPTTITIEGISNYYKEGIFVDAVIADIELNNGDTLNLYAQSGANNTTLTIYLLNTSYIGDR